MMKKVMLIGNGAREHVIAETLKRSSHEVELYAFGKALNPGIESLSEDYRVGDYMDQDEVLNYALHVDPDFVIIGPEDPIDSGLADKLLEQGYGSVAPLQAVAKLESSKSFTRELLANHDIPGNPQFKVFTSVEGIREFMEELDGQFVVKYDGLKGGKGVKVVGDHLEGIEEGYLYAVECLEGCGQVVIEEKLIGQEFSLISFADGVSLAHMPAVQDHKRAYDGDTGPNTGGMGTYSDSNHMLPFLSEEDIATAHAMNEAVLEALRDETGTEFKGIMYGGFIATKKGVSLIEYNCRFGDPEAMNLLPILKTDFVDVCIAIIKGTLSEMEVEFENSATVCKYVVPDGYPDNPCKGDKIEVGEIPEGVNAYYGSVDKKEDGLYLSGSRAIAFVGIGETLDVAEKLAAGAVNSVQGPVFYRTDIGTSEVIEKKIAYMKELRG
jgi:phosphoribosylamine--glycine ligase